MSDSLQTQVRLPVRVRRTIDGDGEMTAVLLVHCESNRRSVVLDQGTKSTAYSPLCSTIVMQMKRLRSRLI